MRGAGFRVGSLLVLTAFLAGCAVPLTETRTGPGTAPSASDVWRPPPGAAPAPASRAPRRDVPPDLVQRARNLTLGDLIDLSLRNSPLTRAAWSTARAAAADLGSKNGAYYPEVELDASYSRAKGSAAAGRIPYQQTTFGPSLNLTYLLFDTGGRRASIEEARQALLAADWTHNAVIQDVVLAVEQAYYGYLASLALRDTAETAVKESQANLDAAEGRHAAGVATIADVLQARTTLSRARLSLDVAEGQIQTLRGVLATVVGFPANTPFDVAIPVDDIPIREVSEEVDKLIGEAEIRRSDLLAARSEVDKALAHVGKVRSEGRISAAATASLGRLYFGDASNQQDTYAGALMLRVPIFTGFSHSYDLLKAKNEAETAQARRDTLEQRVVFQVWNSYYSLRTAARRVETSRELLASATQSQEVALARYKAGVGSVLDLLTAQAALSSARAEEVTARADWHLSLAQLARDTGTLWPREGREIDAASSQPDTKGKP